MTYDDRTRTNDRPFGNDRPRSNIPPGEYREEHIAPSSEANTFPQTINAKIDYHDLVRWGPIIAGIVITIASQLILSSLGIAIGFSIGATGADAGDIGLGVGIWAIISLLIALFIGGWVMARTCGPMNKRTALLNGAILWAATLVVSGWLLASGVTGTFGMALSGANAIVSQIEEPGGIEMPANPTETIPNIPPEQAEAYSGNIARASWYFLIGSLLGLVAALIGATAGARKPRTREIEAAR